MLSVNNLYYSQDWYWLSFVSFKVICIFPYKIIRNIILYHLYSSLKKNFFNSLRLQWCYKSLSFSVSISSLCPALRMLTSIYFPRLHFYLANCIFITQEISYFLIMLPQKCSWEYIYVSKLMEFQMRVFHCM